MRGIQQGAKILSKEKWEKSGATIRGNEQVIRLGIKNYGKGKEAGRNNL